MKVFKALLVILALWCVCAGCGSVLGEVGFWFIQNVILVSKIQNIVYSVAGILVVLCGSAGAWFVWWLSLPGGRCTWFDHKP